MTMKEQECFNIQCTMCWGYECTGTTDDYNGCVGKEDSFIDLDKILVEEEVS